MNPIVPLVQLILENAKLGMHVAEVGVYDGSTTKAYIDIIRKMNGKLYVIDWFAGNPTAIGPHAYNESRVNDVYATFVKNLDGYSDIVTIKSGRSADKIPEIPDASLDICFIDADHRYSHVYEDICLALPKMKAGGILCGHDCEDIRRANTFQKTSLEQDYVNGLHCGVIQAVYDHFGIGVDIRHGPMDPIWIKRL